MHIPIWAKSTTLYQVWIWVYEVGIVKERCGVDVAMIRLEINTNDLNFFLFIVYVCETKIFIRVREWWRWRHTMRCCLQTFISSSISIHYTISIFVDRNERIKCWTVENERIANQEVIKSETSRAISIFGKYSWLNSGRDNIRELMVCFQLQPLRNMESMHRHSAVFNIPFDWKKKEIINSLSGEGRKMKAEECKDRLYYI